MKEEPPAHAAVSFGYVAVSGGYRLDTFSGASTDKNIVIPSTYNGQPVVAIKNGLFKEKPYIESIHIPATIINIGEYIYPTTFEKMPALKSITVEEGNDYYMSHNDGTGQSVLYSHENGTPITLLCYPQKKTANNYQVVNGTRYIGMLTVYNNDYLTGVSLPNTIIGIGNYAFDNCSNLNSVNIPVSTEGVGYRCFSNTNLSSSGTIISATKAEFGKDAFLNTPIYSAAGNNNIYYEDGWAVGIKGTLSGSSVTIAANTKGIAGGLFSGNSTITTVSLPNTITTIPAYTFAECTNLSTINIPTSLTYLGWAAFQRTKVSSLNFGNTSIKEIFPDTFYNCTSLTSVTLPSTVTRIHEGAFTGSKLYTNVSSGLVQVSNWVVGFRSSPTSASFTNVIGIADSALAGCTLTSVSLPSTLKYIGEKAFYGSNSITSLTLNAHADVSMAEYAFGNLTNLSNLTITNIKNIGDYAFAGSMTNPSSVTVSLPTSLLSIGNNAFQGCTKLAAGSFTIPSSVKSIGYYAFQNTGLYNSAANGIIYKNNWALDYKGTRSATSITFNSGTIGLAGCILSGFTSLTGVTIPNTVKYVGTHAFYNCNALTQIVFPASVESIGEFAFFMCRSLDRIMVVRDHSDITDAGLGLFYSSPDAMVYVRPASETTYEAADNWDYYSAKIGPVAEITFGATSGGSTSSASAIYFPGTSVSQPYSATYNEGYYLTGWKLNGSTIVSHVLSGNYTSSSISGGLHHVVANFSQVPGSYTSSFTYNGNGQGPAASAITGFSVVNSYTGTHTGGSYTSASKPAHSGSYSYTATIQYSGSTVGSRSQAFTIGKKAFNTTNITVSGLADLTYNGSAQTPVYTVSDNVTGALSPGIYTYSASLSNNTNASTSAKLTLTGQGDYQGTFDKLFTINPKNVYGNVTIAAIEAVNYKATAYTPTPAVTDTARDVLLVNSTDITYSYSNNTNAGTATVTVNGTGNYTGSTDASFTINKSNVALTANNITKTYGDSLGDGDISGTAKNASFTSVPVAGGWSFDQVFNATPLCADSGSYNVKFTPTDTANYNQPSSISLALTVNQKTLTISGVSGVDKVFDGNTLVQLTGGTLQGVQYGDALTVTLGTANTPNPNVGLHTLTDVNIQIGGARSANYSFIQPTVTANITPKSLVGNVTVAAIEDQYYTSEQITPTPDVTDNALGVLLGNSVDIVYTYSNNIETTSAAIVIITGTGNYKDQVQTTFIIKKISVLISPDDIVKTYGESLGDADITGAAKNGNNPEVDVEGVWSFVSAINPNPLCADSGIYTVRFSPTDTFNYQDPDDITLTLTVNKRDITIANVLGINRPFNGDTLVQLSGGTLQNLVYSDIITFTLGTGNTTSPDAADYIVGNLNIQIHGDRVANYHLIQPTDVPVTIVPKDVAGAVTIADIAPYYYTTLAHTPTPAVTDNALSVALVSGTDMTYSYTSNVNAGTMATVTVNGTGNYTGTESKTFTILKSNVTITANDITKIYGQSLGDADIVGTAKNANNLLVDVAGSFTFA
ncbi:MAG: leucine-rich repeat protein, partial [Clostridia bacterium]|nr:leucine-rich repeat protein [Clostridia bacterium]